MKLKHRIIPFIEIVLGAILLIREIYKEHTYSLIFLWSILLFTGVSSWVSDKLNWMFTQILLIAFAVIILYPAISYSSLGILFKIVSDLILLGFIFLEIRLYRPILTEKLNITHTNKMVSISLGLMSSLMYWIIKVKLESNIMPSF